MPLTNYSNLNSTSCVLPGQNSTDGLDGMSADELYLRVWEQETWPWSLLSTTLREVAKVVMESSSFGDDEGKLVACATQLPPIPRTMAMS